MGKEYVCQICATKYEVKNPSVVKKTNENVNFLRCPKDNGYAFEVPTTEKQEVQVTKAKRSAAKERQNKAETPATKAPAAKVDSDDVKEIEVSDKN